MIKNLFSHDHVTKGRALVALVLVFLSGALFSFGISALRTSNILDVRTKEYNAQIVLMANDMGTLTKQLSSVVMQVGDNTQKLLYISDLVSKAAATANDAAKSAKSSASSARKSASEGRAVTR